MEVEVFKNYTDKEVNYPVKASLKMVNAGKLKLLGQNLPANLAITNDSIVDIYHVHGLLPYEKYDEDRFRDSLIFNESEYFYLYNNPYSWNISKQLHDFKFNECIFIGISLTDPNMKRLLELASNYFKFNFIFMKREKGFSEKTFIDVTNYFFTYDLITIWIDEYEEIGSYLEMI